MEIKQEAISTYLNLLKNKFGENLGKVIEEVLVDEMNMNFKTPEEWNEEEFRKWGKMDLEWNAFEDGIEVVTEEEAKEIYKGTLGLCGLEKYFI